MCLFFIIIVDYVYSLCFNFSFTDNELHLSFHHISLEFIQLSFPIQFQSYKKIIIFFNTHLMMNEMLQFLSDVEICFFYQRLLDNFFKLFGLSKLFFFTLILRLSRCYVKFNQLWKKSVRNERKMSNEFFSLENIEKWRKNCGQGQDNCLPRRRIIFRERKKNDEKKLSEEGKHDRIIFLRLWIIQFSIHEKCS